MPIFVVTKSVVYRSKQRVLIAHAEAEDADSAKRMVIDALNKVTLWNTDPLPRLIVLRDDQEMAWYGDGMPKGGWTVAPYAKMANPAESLTVGTMVLSIRGETGDSGQFQDMRTGPMAKGVISAVLPDQEHCYGVDFPLGISVFLSPAELNITEQYRVFDQPTFVGRQS